MERKNVRGKFCRILKQNDSRIDQDKGKGEQFFLKKSQSVERLNVRLVNLKGSLNWYTVWESHVRRGGMRGMEGTSWALTTH